MKNILVIYHMKHPFHKIRKHFFSKRQKFPLIPLLTILITVCIFGSFGYFLYLRNKPLTVKNKPIPILQQKNQSNWTGSDIATWIAIFVAVSAATFGANSAKEKKQKK